MDVTFPADQAWVKVQYSLQASVVGDLVPQARLTIGDHVATGTMKDGWVLLDLPDRASAGTAIQLEVCLCQGSPLTTTQYQLDLDGRSWWDIPYQA